VIHKYLQILGQQARPARFLVSRLLMRTGLCRLITIRRAGYRLTFFPSSLSAAMWISPCERCEDERLFRRYLRPGDTVVDVGANIGALAITAALAVGKSGKVYAIEAHPRIHRYLIDNLKLNGLDNVAAMQCALGDEVGQATLSDIRSDDQNRVSPSGQGLVVPLSRLDDLPIGEERIDLLKIDVEGFELAVLRGGPRILQRTQCVYFESNDSHCARFGHRPGELVELLARAGFRCFQTIDEQRLGRVSGTHSSPGCENLLALRDPQAFAARTGLEERSSPA
jgi:FkbM family methyltransferase